MPPASTLLCRAGVLFSVAPPPPARVARAYYKSGKAWRKEQQARDHQPFASSLRTIRHTRGMPAFRAFQKSTSKDYFEYEHRSGGSTSTLLILILLHILILGLVLIQSDAAHGSRHGPTFYGGLFGLFCQYAAGIQRR